MNVRLTIRTTLVVSAALLIVACDDAPPNQPAVANTIATAMPAATSAGVQRWYDEARVTRGAELYAANCAACHGKRGEGSANWQTKGADGKLPPPPLNGTAHSWHHPIAAIAYQVRNGAPGGQGGMPAFGDRFNNEQLADLIAHVQSFWNDDIYSKWLQIEARSRQQQ